MNATSIAFSPFLVQSPHSWSRKCRGRRVSCDHSSIEVSKISYRPPGTENNLLSEVSFSLPEKSFGLIFGRSGSGKTTLLQLLAGFSKPTSGSIYVQRYGNDGNPNRSPEVLSPERVGIVFQFPERYFLSDTVIEELTFGWPRQKADIQMREQLALKLQYAFDSVGLNTIPLDADPHSLSGGFKRRLALAIQLVQKPDLLLLDEPLAGLGSYQLLLMYHGGWTWVEYSRKNPYRYNTKASLSCISKKGTITSIGIMYVYEGEQARSFCSRRNHRKIPHYILWIDCYF